MPDQPRGPSKPDRRTDPDRRGYHRGGRRRGDWPATLLAPPTCPRCASPEARFVEGTTETLFWRCHRCQHEWETRPDGSPVAM